MSSIVVDHSGVKSFVYLKIFSSSMITDNKSVVSPRHMETRLKSGSRISAMIGESLSVTFQGEHSKRILLMSNRRQ